MSTMNKKVVAKINEGAVKTILPLMNGYSSRKEWENACWYKILASQELLGLFITARERHNLVMRVAALERLATGKSYKQIGDELWLSPQTISGIKKAIHEKSYRSYLERSKKERKRRRYGARITSIKPKPTTPSGIPHRTKYGTIYL